MRKPALFAAILFGSLLFAQTAEESRVLRFSSGPTVQDFLESATVIRALAEIRDFTADSDQRTVTLRASAPQVAFAEWLVRELDPPAPADPSAIHEYPLDAGDIARVFYVQNAATVQQFQEMATAVRATADIRRLFTYNRPRAIALRGTPEQAATAGWLFGELDQPVAKQWTAGVREHRMAGSGDENVVRVFYLPDTATVQDLQEAATMVRAMSDIRRVFTYSTSRAVITRGTGEQMALAEWLFTELGKSAQPAGAPAAREYRMTGGGENVVRLFWLAHAGTPQRLQEIAQEVRSAEHIRRVFVCNRPRLVAMRGTPDQMDAAGHMIADRDR